MLYTCRSTGGGGGYNDDRNGYGGGSRRGYGDDYAPRRGGYGDSDYGRQVFHCLLTICLIYIYLPERIQSMHAQINLKMVMDKTL